MIAVLKNLARESKNGAQWGTAMATRKRTKPATAPKPTELGGADEATWSIRPPDDVRELVKIAMQATGKKRQTLLMEVIREKLPEVVERMIRERKEAERLFRPPDDPEDKK